MCLAIWATELATHREAMRATITASGAAPPANEIPIGIENAVAIAGAMNVIDWKRIPPKPTAPRRSSLRSSAFGVGADGGVPAAAIRTLVRLARDPRVYAHRPSDRCRDRTVDGFVESVRGDRPGYSARRNSTIATPSMASAMPSTN